MNNPLQMIKMLMSGGKNIQDVALQMIGNTNNPVIQNLVKMAQNGDYQGVENVARNMFKEQGRDFDAELKDLQSIVSNFR